jgi:hypothetical protein
MRKQTGPKPKTRKTEAESLLEPLAAERTIDAEWPTGMKDARQTTRQNGTSPAQSCDMSSGNRKDPSQIQEYNFPPGEEPIAILREGEEPYIIDRCPCGGAPEIFEHQIRCSQCGLSTGYVLGGLGKTIDRWYELLDQKGKK